MSVHISAPLVWISLGCALSASTAVAGTALRILTRQEAALLLAQEDDYTRHLTPIDLTSATGNPRLASREVFLATLAQDADMISEQETQKLSKSLEWVLSSGLPFDELLPGGVQVAKIAGEVYAGKSFTRGDAIFLTSERLAQPVRELRLVLAHELFHVISRQNPALRERLYALFGCEPATVGPLPPEVEQFRTTNPDAPYPTCITPVKIRGGDEVEVVPFLLAERPYTGGNADSYFALRLVQVEWDARTASWTPLVAQDGRSSHSLAALDPDETDWSERMGENTSYTIDVEEAAAENFAALVTIRADGTMPWRVRNPELVRRMGQVIEDYAGSAQ